MPARIRVLRWELFSCKTQRNHDVDHEEEWFVDHWPEYVKRTFESTDPGPKKALKELKEMVDSGKTPEVKAVRKRRGQAKPIPRPGRERAGEVAGAAG